MQSPICGALLCPLGSFVVSVEHCSCLPGRPLPPSFARTNRLISLKFPKHVHWGPQSTYTTPKWDIYRFLATLQTQGSQAWGLRTWNSHKLPRWFWWAEGGSLPRCVGVFGPRLPPWGLAPQAVPFVPSCPPTPALHPSTCRNLSSEVFCFMSQLLLSFFTPSFPGASQQHSPDILKLLAPHPRLKEHVESLATEGTIHNLPKLSQVKLHSPSSLLTLRLAVLWANMESEPSPSYFVWFLRKKK